VLTVASGKIVIEDVDVLCDGLILEVTYTNAEGTKKEVAFLNRDGEWLRSLGRKELRQICDWPNLSN
jgi:hypothetical protein